MRRTCVVILLFIALYPCRAAVPDFDEQRAFGYLKAQCDFGPRYPGSSGHKACLDFLFQELGKRTSHVQKQPFRDVIHKTGQSVGMTNVIASFGEGKIEWLLCAHWDTRPWADSDPDPAMRNQPVLGANDGASGVAVLLEIARHLQNHPPSRRIEIVLFDGEDSGTQGVDASWCLGSRYYARQLSPAGKAEKAVLVDMIGDRELSLPMEGNSLRYAPRLTEKIWDLAESLGLWAFQRKAGPDIIDDHLELMKVGIPAVNIIDFDYPWWHTIHDTADKCSPESLGAVGRLLLHLIYENSGLD